MAVSRYIFAVVTGLAGGAAAGAALMYFYILAFFSLDESESDPNFIFEIVYAFFSALVAAAVATWISSDFLSVQYKRKFMEYFGMFGIVAWLITVFVQNIWRDAIAQSVTLGLASGWLAIYLWKRGKSVIAIDTLDEHLVNEG